MSGFSLIIGYMKPDIKAKSFGFSCSEARQELPSSCLPYTTPHLDPHNTLPLADHFDIPSVDALLVDPDLPNIEELSKSKSKLLGRLTLFCQGLLDKFTHHPTNASSNPAGEF
jgi:hypothetical protein